MGEDVRATARDRVKQCIARGDGVLDLTDLGLTSMPDEAWGIRNLRRLKLGGNTLGDAGAENLAKQLKLLPGLVQLNLRKNRIGSAGMKHIAENLRHVPSLIELNLHLNEIAASGATELAKHLRHVPRLKELSVRANFIGPIGGGELAQHLRDVPGLRRLDMGGTYLGSDAAKQIADTLTALPRLRWLDISWNDIAELYRAFATHPSLRTLWVAGNLQLGLPDELRWNTNPKTLWAYWSKAKPSGGGDILREVKVQVLGNGGAGKTSVVHVLFGEIPPKRHSMTQSFEKRLLQLGTAVPEHRNRVELMQYVGAWVFDYGGQPHLHGSHRLFLADRRNLWLVLARSDQSRAENRLDYWLGLVRYEHERGRRDRDAWVRRKRRTSFETLDQSLYKNELPPVVIVLESFSRAKGAGVLEGLDAEKLSKQFGLRVRVVRQFDSDPGGGNPVGKLDLLDALRQAVLDLPDVWGQRFPGSFDRLRRKVLEWESDPANTRTTTSGLWRSWEIETYVEPELEGVYLPLARDLGYLMYVGDRVGVSTRSDSKLRTAVYNPRWVKDPVYRVLWGNAATGRDGFVPSEIMHELLRGIGCAGTVVLDEEEQRRDILALMEECGLVFSVKDELGNEVWLVPDHLGTMASGERVKWPDAELAAIGTFGFLPDHALLPLIGTHFSRRARSVHPARDQFAFVDNRVAGNSSVSVLIQADGVSGQLSCWFKGGDVRARAGSLERIQDLLESTLGLSGHWQVESRPQSVATALKSGAMSPDPAQEKSAEVFRYGPLLVRPEYWVRVEGPEPLEVLLGTRNTHVLFVRLALAKGGRVHARNLHDALWPNEPERRKRLQNEIDDLRTWLQRQGLSPYVEIPKPARGVPQYRLVLNGPEGDHKGTQRDSRGT